MTMTANDLWTMYLHENKDADFLVKEVLNDCHAYFQNLAMPGSEEMKQMNKVRVAMAIIAHKE